MCIGTPMQVLESGFGFARCKARDGEHEIDMSLVGEVAPGSWVMVFMGAAREEIDEETALRCQDALLALELVMRGETQVDHLFQDLLQPERLTEMKSD